MGEHLAAGRKIDPLKLQLILDFLDDCWLSDAVSDMPIDMVLLQEMIRATDDCVENRKQLLGGPLALATYLLKFLFLPVGRLTQLSFTVFFFGLLAFLVVVSIVPFYSVSTLKQEQIARITEQLFQLDEELASIASMGSNPVSASEGKVPGPASGNSPEALNELEAETLAALNERKQNLERSKRLLASQTILQNMPSGSVGIMFLALFYVTWVVCLKRQHDRGAGGTVFLISVILPWALLGLLFVLFFAGRDEDNIFGRRPSYLLASGSLRRELLRLLGKHAH